MQDAELSQAEEQGGLSFTAHLEELRWRLLRCVIAIAIGFGVSYFYKEEIFNILMDPLLKVMNNHGKIIFTGLTEAFFTYLKVALISGIMLAFPYLAFEFWMFVTPGLYKHEKRILAPAIFLSALFFVGGALFGYFAAFPFGFQFFLSFSNENIQALPSMKEYMSLASLMLLAFGAVFETPLVITIMASLGIVTPAFLKKNRKYAVVIIFVIAAIITPGPDVMSQCIMAGPLLVLYEISILGAKIFGKSRKNDDETEVEEASGD